MSIRCGVVGAGYIGRRHIEAFRRLEGCDVVGIVDPDEASRSAVMDEFGLTGTADLAHLFDRDLDAVSICSPTATHLAIAVSALERGIHVLVEKPMAATTVECQTMMDAATESGAILMVGFTHRFHSELQVARRLIDAGDLGEVRLASDFFSFGQTSPWPSWWYSAAMSGGGELLHDGVHLIDRLAWLIGQRVRVAFGATTIHGRGESGVEDGAAACLLFEGGAVASLFVNQAPFPIDAPAHNPRLPGWCTLELHGTEGSIRYETWERLAFAGHRSAFTVLRRDNDELLRELNEFITAIHEHRQPSVTGRDGYDAVAVVEAIYASSQSGSAVPVVSPRTGSNSPIRSFGQGRVGGS